MSATDGFIFSNASFFACFMKYLLFQKKPKTEEQMELSPPYVANAKLAISQKEAFETSLFRKKEWSRLRKSTEAELHGQ